MAQATQEARQLQRLQRATTHDLVRFALELGAADVGGQLSSSEVGLIRETYKVPKPSREELAIVRDMILAGEDPLGEAFCQALSPEERRPLGAVYTPPAIVAPMVEWVMSKRPVRVVDAGAGSGRYAVAAARRDPAVQVLAVDVDPVATLICRANCAVLGLTNVRVIQGDYLTLELPPAYGRTAFVGNPPYVRHHDLPPELKAWAREAGDRLGVPVSGLAGLHVLFMMATALLARAGDVGCFVTSAEWLDVGYGATARHLLSGRLGVRSLYRIDPTSAPFGETMTTALIFCFEVGSAGDRIVVARVPSAEDLRDLDHGERTISRERAADAERWSPFFAVGEPRAARAPKTDRVPLGSLVRVSRGVATGANGFFVMTAAEAERLGLSRFARPVITRAQEIFGSSGVIRADGLKVIIDLPRDMDPTAPGMEAVREYLARGMSAGVHERYLCAHRSPWWYLGLAIPPVVATYMARQAPRFALNPNGAAILNVAHGLYPRLPLTDGELLALVRYLNAARETFVGSGRVYHGGLEKFEPRELEALPVPSLSALRRMAEGL